MDLKDIATAFGLPGLMIGVWYLLQTAQNKRGEAADKARNELEEKKVAAMTTGFQMLAQKIDSHSTVEIAHHTDVAKGISEMHGRLDGILDMGDRFTPVGPTPKPRTPPRGLPTEYSQHRRASTRNEED